MDMFIRSSSEASYAFNTIGMQGLGMSSFDQMAAARDWLDAYRTASLSIVDLYSDTATLECDCDGQKVIAGRDALIQYWRLRFAERPAGGLADLQPDEAGIVICYRVPNGIVEARLNFDEAGKIDRSRCGDAFPRDQYTWDLECPDCGSTGAAEVSEDAFPHRRQLNFAVDVVSDGFEVRKLGETASDTEIICVKCGVTV
jgi:hypothetical protein